MEAPRYTKTKAELFAAVRVALFLEGEQAALKEIERRYDARKVLLFNYELNARGAKLVQHLERALEDARAFERAHIVVSSIANQRNNAENRAWQCFEDWRQELVEKGDARLFEVVIVPPSHGKLYAAEIWGCLIENGKCVRRLVKGKDGTSRVDALAHLASWCQAESEEALPTAYCGHDGPCGLGVPKCVQELVNIGKVE